jgi:8-oxo-dGTP diphosphatase
MSTSFIARAKGMPKAGDDAARCIVCKPDELPGKLVFDHALIVSDYSTYKQTGKRPPPRR